MRTIRRPGTLAPPAPTVRSLMSRSVVSVDPSATLTRAAAEMRANRIGSLLVRNNGDITGIITERDLMRALADDRRDAAYAAAVMVRHRLRHLPVVEGGRPVGLLSARDLLALEPWPKQLPPLEPW